MTNALAHNQQAVTQDSTKIWTDLSSVLSQSTRLTDGQMDRRSDGRTDGQTPFS